MDKPIKIFNDNGIHIDGAAIAQFMECMSQSWAVKGALMPDAHKGYTLPIGGVVATDGVIVPAKIGYDIGCGVCAVKLSLKREDILPYTEDIFAAIYKEIPTGFSHNVKPSKWPKYEKIKKTEFMEELFKEKSGSNQLCSLGGGNHFIEIGFDENDDVWITIHSGSRGIGHSAAKHYMGVASGDGKAREGCYALDINSQEGKDYIVDLNFCLEFALENRRQMIIRVASTIDKALNNKDEEVYVGTLASILTEGFFINKNHNHAELKNGLWIHRKGATHAEEGMMGVIPGNMKDGSFIVRGKGNPDSLYSSSHGAGRVCGRAEAKRTLNIEDFEKDMEGITAKVGQETLDESRLAYKSIFEVMEAQTDLVEIIHHVKPIINIKA